MDLFTFPLVDFQTYSAVDHLDTLLLQTAFLPIQTAKGEVFRQLSLGVYHFIARVFPGIGILMQRIAHRPGQPLVA